MAKVNCSVIGCSNSTYKCNKWKKDTCTKHNLEAEGNWHAEAIKKETALNVNHRFIYILLNTKGNMDKSGETRTI